MECINALPGFRAGCIAYFYGRPLEPHLSSCRLGALQLDSPRTLEHSASYSLAIARKIVQIEHSLLVQAGAYDGLIGKASTEGRTSFSSSL